MIQRLALFVLRSLFLYGYTWPRQGTILLQALHPLAAYASLQDPFKAALIVAGQAAFYAATGMNRLFLYSLLIASIPGAWMSSTQAVIDYIQGGLDPGRYAAIFLRSLAASLPLLYLIHTLNPTEISRLIYRLTGSCNAAYAPLVLMRVIGGQLKDSSEALAAHRLKGVRPWTTLAVLLLRSRETAVLVEEGFSQRARRCRPRTLYSRRAVAAQAILGLYDATLLLTL